MPFEAAFTEAPQSSIALCSGWDGGTQCDSRRATGLSCAKAAVAENRTAAATASTRDVMISSAEKPRDCA